MSERAGRLLLDGALVPGHVRFERGRITGVEPDPAVPADAPLIAPGLVDLHVHGYGGKDPLDDLAGMAAALAAAGTTAFQPTLFPDTPEELGADADRVFHAGAALERTARVVGLHLEGPFVNPAKAGALPPSKLVVPSPAALRAILGPDTAGGRGIRTVTLAPELPGADELTRELVRAGVRVSLGHSAATYRDAARAARAGACGATHLFNAMAPLHHRETGLANFALSDDALFAEIIGDLVHVAPEAFRLALRARGTRGLALVSDALWAAGTGCDVFHSHGRRCFARDGALWTYPLGPAGEELSEQEGGEPLLTGAAASQLEACRRLVAAGVCSAAEALTMAAETPARALGLEEELGRLAPGARADLLVLDADLGLLEVLVGSAAGSRPGPLFRSGGIASMNGA